MTQQANQERDFSELMRQMLLTKPDTEISHLDDKKAICYIEGTLNSNDRQEVVQHLQECEACWADIEIFRYALQMTPPENVPEPSPDFMERGWQEVQRRWTEEKVAAALQEISGNVVIPYNRGLADLSGFLRRLVASGVSLAGNLIEPVVAFENGKNTRWFVPAKVATLSQLVEKGYGNLIIVGSTEEIHSLSNEAIPDLFVRWQRRSEGNGTDSLVDMYRLEEDKGSEAESAEQQATRFRESTLGKERVFKAAEGVLLHALAVGEGLPAEWLVKAGYATINPHPVMNLLREAHEVLTPIDPLTMQILDWDEAPSYVAADEKVARWVLQDEALPSRIQEHFIALIQGLMIDSPLSADVKMLTRHLYALWLRGYGPVLYRVLSATLDSLYPLWIRLGEEENVPYLMTWGKICARGRQPVEALELLHQAETIARDKSLPELPYIWRARAALSMEREQVREAQFDLEKAYAYAPSLPVRTALAAAYARTPAKDAQERALALIREARTSSPDNPYPDQIEGGVHARFGMQTSAWPKRRDCFAQAVICFRHAWEKDPKSVPTLTAWAALAMDRGHLNPPKELNRETEPFEGEPVFKYEDEPIYSAMDLLRQAHRIEPENVSTLVSLGRLHTELRNYRDAEDLLRYALTIEPENVRVLITLAHLYRKQEKFEEAGRLLDEARGLDDENPYIAAERAQWLLDQQAWTEAIDLLQNKEVHAQGTSKVALQNLLVKAYLQARDMMAAVDQFITVRDMQPSNPQTYNNWVEALIAGRSQEEVSQIAVETGDPREIANLARQIDPHNAYTLAICARLAALYGDPDADEYRRQAQSLGLPSD